MENNRTDPFRSGDLSGMNTLKECYDLALEHGYIEEFTVSETGTLFAPTHQRHHEPAEIHVVNFYRFEGASNPDDMSILYIIETTGGIKGTLIDAYGTYADSNITDFIVQVQDFHKRVDKK